MLQARAPRSASLSRLFLRSRTSTAGESADLACEREKAKARVKVRVNRESKLTVVADTLPFSLLVSRESRAEERAAWKQEESAR